MVPNLPCLVFNAPNPRDLFSQRDQFVKKTFKIIITKQHKLQIVVVSVWRLKKKHTKILRTLTEKKNHKLLLGLERRCLTKRGLKDILLTTLSDDRISQSSAGKTGEPGHPTVSAELQSHTSTTHHTVY